MGKIIVSENVSLDGVVQDPTGDEGFRVGGWFGQINNTDHEEWANVGLDEALRAEALLLGRRTYEFFGARWPFRTGQWADRLNGMRKYVVSTTLHAPEWNNSTVLRGNVVREATALRRKIKGDLVVYGSFQLVHTLLEHDLVDELRMTMFPSVLGIGERLFGATSGKKDMRLVGTRTVGNGLASLTYRPRA